MDKSSKLKHSKPCSMKIEFNDSLRSIDLENILIGTRMIYQHELARQYGMKTRDFTNFTRITGVEKGSIDVFYNIITDPAVIAAGVGLAASVVNLTAAVISLLSETIKSNNQEKRPIEIHIHNYQTALRNIDCITFTEEGMRTKVWYDHNGVLNFTQEIVNQQSK